MPIKKTWIGGDNGHWRVTNGIESIECDPSELHRAIDYLKGLIDEF